jgi:hypothetical protein
LERIAGSDHYIHRQSRRWLGIFDDGTTGSCSEAVWDTAKLISARFGAVFGAGAAEAGGPFSEAAEGKGEIAVEGNRAGGVGF